MTAPFDPHTHASALYLTLRDATLPALQRDWPPAGDVAPCQRVAILSGAISMLVLRIDVDLPGFAKTFARMLPHARGALDGARRDLDAPGGLQ